jgi:hypothetical protein
MTNFLADKDHMKVLQDVERDRWHDALIDPDASVEAKRLYRIQTYHIAVNWRPFPELHDREDIARLRKDSRDVLRSHGIFGECSIPHLRDEGDPGAHVHFLALAGFIRPGGKDDPYIIEVIEHEGSWYPRNRLDRFHVVKYACTHAVITTDSDCLTWSGCVANNKYKNVKYEDVAHGGPICPHCKGTWTFKVRGREWHQKAEVETWVAPDRPPPDVPQRAMREFA